MTATITRAEAKARGLRHYFTGKACRNGHVARRQLSNGTCIQCQDATRVKYRSDPVKRSRETAGHRDWNDRNREHVSRYTEANRPRVRATLAAWNAANKDRRRAHVLNRRALRSAAMPADFGEFDRLVMSEAAAACIRREAMHGEAFHVDHMIPLSRGGLHAWSNVQVIPARLNLRKRNRLIYTRPGEWIRDA